MDFWNEELELTIEIISNLYRIKSTLIELLLKPAGVQSEVYLPIINKIDPFYKKQISKRQIAPLIVDELKKLPKGREIIRNIINISSKFSDFHLSEDEYKAKAVVIKAKELLEKIDAYEAKEKINKEIELLKERKIKEEEYQIAFKKELHLLLCMFDDIAKETNHQKRGFLLEGLLARLFSLWQITVHKSFKRNDNGEQIDGAFEFENQYFLVECKWKENKSDMRQLDGLQGLLNRSGKQTSGLFLSMNGWSDNVVPLLKQNNTKAIILMDGYDLRCILDGSIDLGKFIKAKQSKLNIYAEPYLGAKEFLEKN